MVVHYNKVAGGNNVFSSKTHQAVGNAEQERAATSNSAETPVKKRKKKPQKKNQKEKWGALPSALSFSRRSKSFRKVGNSPGLKVKHWFFAEEKTDSHFIEGKKRRPSSRVNRAQPGQQWPNRRKNHKRRRRHTCGKTPAC